MKEFDPKHAARNGYSREDWEAVESPELTDADLARAKPFATAFPAITEKIRKYLGGFQKSPTSRSASARPR